MTADWFNLLSANDFSDGNPLHWITGQHNKYCFIHISMHQTKLTLAGLLRAGGGSSCLIITGNGPEFNVPFAFPTTKLPEELKTTWLCHALSLKPFFPRQPVQPGLSQTTRHGHCLQGEWHSDTKFWSHTKPLIGYLLPSVSHLFQMFHSHSRLRIWATPRTKVQT